MNILWHLTASVKYGTPVKKVSVEEEKINKTTAIA
jgi:hypothetical protein